MTDRRPLRRHRRRRRRAVDGGARRRPGAGRARDAEGVSADDARAVPRPGGDRRDDRGRPARRSTSSRRRPSDGSIASRELLAADAGSRDRAQSPTGSPPSTSRRSSAVGDAAGASRALLDAGADVNARSDNEFSVLPIHSAVGGQPRRRRRGADRRRAPTSTRRSATAGRRSTARPRTGVAVTVDRLLAAGADPAGRATTTGRPPADLAAAAGHDGRRRPPELTARPSHRGGDERFRDARRHTLSSTTAVAVPQSRRPWTSEHSWSGRGEAIMTPSRSCSTCGSRGWTRPPG